MAKSIYESMKALIQKYDLDTDRAQDAQGNTVMYEGSSRDLGVRFSFIGPVDDHVMDSRLVIRSEHGSISDVVYARKGRVTHHEAQRFGTSIYRQLEENCSFEGGVDQLFKDYSNSVLGHSGVDDQIDESIEEQFRKLGL